MKRKAKELALGFIMGLVIANGGTEERVTAVMPDPIILPANNQKAHTPK